MVRHFVPSASFSTDNLRELVDTLPASAEGSQPPPTLAQLDTPSPSTGPVSQECTVEDLEGTLMVDAMNIPRRCIGYSRTPHLCPV